MLLCLFWGVLCYGALSFWSFLLQIFMVSFFVFILGLFLFTVLLSSLVLGYSLLIVTVSVYTTHLCVRCSHALVISWFILETLVSYMLYLVLLHFAICLLLCLLLGPHLNQLQTWQYHHSPFVLRETYLDGTKMLPWCHKLTGKLLFWGCLKCKMEAIYKQDLKWWVYVFL